MTSHTNPNTTPTHFQPYRKVHTCSVQNIPQDSCKDNFHCLLLKMPDQNQSRWQGRKITHQETRDYRSNSPDSTKSCYPMETVARSTRPDRKSTRLNSSHLGI